MNAILKEGLREVNTSKKFYTGSRWKTNKCGYVTIVGQIDRVHKNAKSTIYPYFLVEFADGTRTPTRRNQLVNGTIKNLNEPIVCGVGYLGYGEHLAWINGKDTREYKCWNHMLRRCYSEVYHNKRPTYKGCTAVERWHNFQNFCEDIKDLPGYEKWLLNENKDMELDKDIRVKGNKIYGPDTCMFVTKEENSIASSLTGYTYRATHIDGREFIFKCQMIFSRKFNVPSRKIAQAVREEKILKGWFIEIIPEDLEI